jgi:hypothetical protein
MKLVWSPEDLIEHWSAWPKDWANIPDTAGEAGCLGFYRPADVVDSAEFRCEEKPTGAGKLPTDAAIASRNDLAATLREEQCIER